MDGEVALYFFFAYFISRCEISPKELLPVPSAKDSEKIRDCFAGR